MSHSDIPLPVLQDWNRPFFAAGLSGKLVLQRCSHCNLLIYYPRMFCPDCLSDQYRWEEMSGLGTVYSFAVVWHPQQSAFDGKVPIILAVIELDEGPQMVSTVINWVRRRRETGSARPGQMGGHKPRKILGDHRIWLLERCRAGDFTLHGLVAELHGRGLVVDYHTVWAFVRAEGFRYKKRQWSRPSGTGRTLHIGEPSG